jgi:hypothetical protein
VLPAGNAALACGYENIGFQPKGNIRYSFDNYEL